MQTDHSAKINGSQIRLSVIPSMPSRLSSHSKHSKTAIPEWCESISKQRRGVAGIHIKTNPAAMAIAQYFAGGGTPSAQLLGVVSVVLYSINYKKDHTVSDVKKKIRKKYRSMQSEQQFYENIVIAKLSTVYLACEIINIQCSESNKMIIGFMNKLTIMKNKDLEFAHVKRSALTAYRSKSCTMDLLGNQLSGEIESDGLAPQQIPDSPATQLQEDIKFADGIFESSMDEKDQEITRLKKLLEQTEAKTKKRKIPPSYTDGGVEQPSKNTPRPEQQHPLLDSIKELLQAIHKQNQLLTQVLSLLPQYLQPPQPIPDARPNSQINLVSASLLTNQSPRLIPFNPSLNPSFGSIG